MFVKSLVDENNQPIGKPEHVEKFLKKPAGETNRALSVLMRVNGLDDKKAEELKKDSGGAP
jgi:hypothetical protein